MLDDTDSEVLPLLYRAIDCLSICRREGTLEETLHELQRRFEGKLVAQGMLEPLLVLHLSMVQISFTHDILWVQQGLVSFHYFIRLSLRCRKRSRRRRTLHVAIGVIGSRGTACHCFVG